MPRIDYGQNFYNFYQLYNEAINYGKKNMILTRDILMTGNVKLLEDFQKANEMRLSPEEKCYLKGLTEANRYIRKLENSKASNKKKTLPTLENVNGTLLLSDIDMPHNQTSFNGCWSVTLEMLLKSRGVNVPQEIIRAFRTYDGSPKEMPKFENGIVGDYNMDHADRITLRGADLLTRTLPNTGMRQRTYNIAKEYDPNDTELSKQLTEDIRRAIEKKRSPVALWLNGHYRTVIGVNPDKQELIFKDSLGQNQNGDYVCKTKDVIDSVCEGENEPTRDIVITWLEDIQPYNIRKKKGIASYYDEEGKIKEIEEEENSPFIRMNEQEHIRTDEQETARYYHASVKSSVKNVGISEEFVLPTKLTQLTAYKETQAPEIIRADEIKRLPEMPHIGKEIKVERKHKVLSTIKEVPEEEDEETTKEKVEEQKSEEQPKHEEPPKQEMPKQEVAAPIEEEPKTEEQPKVEEQQKPEEQPKVEEPPKQEMPKQEPQKVEQPQHLWDKRRQEALRSFNEASGAFGDGKLALAYTNIAIALSELKEEQESLQPYIKTSIVDIVLTFNGNKKLNELVSQNALNKFKQANKSENIAEMTAQAFLQKFSDDTPSINAVYDDIARQLQLDSMKAKDLVEMGLASNHFKFLVNRAMKLQPKQQPQEQKAEQKPQKIEAHEDKEKGMKERIKEIEEGLTATVEFYNKAKKPFGFTTEKDFDLPLKWNLDTSIDNNSKQNNSDFNSNLFLKQMSIMGADPKLFNGPWSPAVNKMVFIQRMLSDEEFAASKEVKAFTDELYNEHFKDFRSYINNANRHALDWNQERYAKADEVVAAYFEEAMKTLPMLVVSTPVGSTAMDYTLQFANSVYNEQTVGRFREVLENIEKKSGTEISVLCRDSLKGIVSFAENYRNSLERSSDYLRSFLYPKSDLTQLTQNERADCLSEMIIAEIIQRRLKADAETIKADPNRDYYAFPTVLTLSKRARVTNRDDNKVNYSVNGVLKTKIYESKAFYKFFEMRDEEILNMMLNECGGLSRVVDDIMGEVAKELGAAEKPEPPKKAEEKAEPKPEKKVEEQPKDKEKAEPKPEEPPKDEEPPKQEPQPATRQVTQHVQPVAQVELGEDSLSAQNHDLDEEELLPNQEPMSEQEMMPEQEVAAPIEEEPKVEEPPQQELPKDEEKTEPKTEEPPQQELPKDEEKTEPKTEEPPQQELPKDEEKTEPKDKEKAEEKTEKKDEEPNQEPMSEQEMMPEQEVAAPIEEEPKTEEQQKPEEQPKVEEPPKQEMPKQVEEEPKPEEKAEEKKPVEEPKNEEKTEEPPKVEEKPKVEEPKTEEKKAEVKQEVKETENEQKAQTTEAQPKEEDAADELSEEELREKAEQKLTERALKEEIKRRKREDEELKKAEERREDEEAAFPRPTLTDYISNIFSYILTGKPNEAVQKWNAHVADESRRAEIREAEQKRRIEERKKPFKPEIDPDDIEAVVGEMKKKGPDLKSYQTGVTEETAAKVDTKLTDIQQKEMEAGKSVGQMEEQKNDNDPQSSKEKKEKQEDELNEIFKKLKEINKNEELPKQMKENIIKLQRDAADARETMQQMIKKAGRDGMIDVGDNLPKYIAYEHVKNSIMNGKKPEEMFNKLKKADFAAKWQAITFGTNEIIHYAKGANDKGKYAEFLTPEGTKKLVDAVDKWIEDVKNVFGEEKPKKETAVETGKKEKTIKETLNSIKKPAGKPPLHKDSKVSEVKTGPAMNALQ